MNKLLTFALAGILAGAPAASLLEAAQLGAVFEAARERAEREKAEKERADRERAERERIERERTDRERADRDRAERERLERERTARDSRGDRVCVYEHSGFQGWEQCFSPGDELGNLRTRGDKISSIRVVGRANVSLFDSTDFRGQELRVADDVPDLVLRSRRSGNWNDSVKSLRVALDRNNDTTRRREPRDGICVYDRTGYQGRSQCWSLGDSLPDLTRSGADWSDRISSIRLFGRASAELYSEVRFRGESLVVDRSISDLSQYRAGPGNGRGPQGRGNSGDRGNGRGNRSWNDQVESLRVVSVRSADNRR